MVVGAALDSVCHRLITPDGAVEQGSGAAARQPFVQFRCEPMTPRKERSLVIGKII